MFQIEVLFAQNPLLKVLLKFHLMLLRKNNSKKLILKHQNSNLKTELQKATEEIRQKSLKKEYKEKGVKENEGILEDDLTIVGIGK